MPSSITSILNAPYLNRYMRDYLSGEFTITNNNANINGHPFSTGDSIFVLFTTVAAVGSLRYAIRVDENTLAIANTLSDANNNIKSFTIPTLTVGIGAIANTPIAYVPNYTGYPSFPANVSTILNQFLSSSKSQQSFAVTDNVQIDFTAPTTLPGASGVKYGLDIFGLISDTGNYNCAIVEMELTGRGDSISGVTWANISSRTLTWRILIQNQRVSIQNRLTSGSYFTTFTSSVLSLNITGLRLFSCFSTNGRSLSNCQITYL